MQIRIPHEATVSYRKNKCSFNELNAEERKKKFKKKGHSISDQNIPKSATDRIEERNGRSV